KKKHIVTLPYEDDFQEDNIPTKARPCQMNAEYLALCKNEIASLIEKKLIRPSKSPWSCTAFYVNKHAEQERGVPRLVINYKPLSMYRGRSNPSYRGGRGNPSYREGRGNSSDLTLLQHGNKKLIASDLSGLAKASNTELEEFKRWKELQKKDDIPGPSMRPSFINVVKNKEQKDQEMIPHNEERVILFLNDNDKRRANEPWILYDRYLNPYGYTMETYKNRLFYESILSLNHCECTRFTGNNKEIYNFSKIFIRKIIS
ncbi:hypothetical protein RND81_11G065800, partial [Saponaria officinalis]